MTNEALEAMMDISGTSKNAANLKSNTPLRMTRIAEFSSICVAGENMPAIAARIARLIGSSLDAVLPVLYLRDVSTGDFQEALSALVGTDEPNLSPSAITRLTSEWNADYEHWQKRDLSGRRYVYVWANGLYLQARMEDQAECMLLLIGAAPEGNCRAASRVVLFLCPIFTVVPLSPNSEKPNLT